MKQFIPFIILLIMLFPVNAELTKLQIPMRTNFISDTEFKIQNQDGTDYKLYSWGNGSAPNDEDWTLTAYQDLTSSSSTSITDSLTKYIDACNTLFNTSNDFNTFGDKYASELAAKERMIESRDRYQGIADTCENDTTALQADFDALQSTYTILEANCANKITEQECTLKHEQESSFFTSKFMIFIYGLAAMYFFKKEDQQTQSEHEEAGQYGSA